MPLNVTDASVLAWAALLAGAATAGRAIRARATRCRQLRAAARAVVAALVAGVVLSMTLSAVSGCGLTLDSRPLAPDATSTDASEPLGRVLRSVVEVRAVEYGLGATRQGIGTGVVFDEMGTIVTNDHVLRIGRTTIADAVEVVLPNGEQVVATVLQSLPDRDLAFLDIDADGLVPAEFVDELGAVEVGQEVIAVGAPRYFRDAVLSGEITLIQEPVNVTGLPGITSIILTDVALRRGFSGGPLADAETGRILGINAGVTVRMGGAEQKAITIPSPLVVDAAGRL